TFYSVCVGAMGAVILVVFLAGILQTGGIEKVLPVIIGFNAALTGYMAVEKSRNEVMRKNLLSMGSGVSMVLLATAGLNILFYHWAGYSLVGIGMLTILLVVGVIASGLGGKLCTKYLKLSHSS
ncbi:MAG: hypothetical protein JRE14_10510, partial [Deltaproteobacteria bacterium]|nr:hypothetical protein [Deltaproteobacteria bacterium]